MYLLQEMTANLRRNCREILYIFQFMYKTSFHFEHPPSHLWAKEYHIASNNTKYPHVFLSWKSSEVYLSINYEIKQWPLQKVGKGEERVVLFGGWGWGGWLEFSTPCSWQVFIFPRHVTSSEDTETMISRLYSSKCIADKFLKLDFIHVSSIWQIKVEILRLILMKTPKSLVLQMGVRKSVMQFVWLCITNNMQ